MKYPDSAIEEVKAKSDILEIVGEHVRLRRAGRNFVGLCPFHDEKTPSFNVSPDRNMYKCFGCGKAGNAISFLMELHGFGFIEAVEALAKRYGIRLEAQNEAEAEQDSRAAKARKALELAATLYSNYLRTPGGATSLAFFNKREFTKETIKKFLLGASPDAWDKLTGELKKKNFQEESLEDAGLVIRRDNGGYYDRFRGRAMFPIRDFMGRVVGFGARKLSEEDMGPKYINSPQTLVYDKSKTLYGIFEAKQAIREAGYALMTEGYADVISLHQAGYQQAVASSGTALTSAQLGLLSRFTKKLYFVYDSDPAGQAAMEKGLEVAISMGFELKMVLMPKGEDPDSLIRNRGKMAFDSSLAQAINFIEFKIKRVEQEGEKLSPPDKARLVRELLALIAKLPDRLEHDMWMGILADKFRMNELQLGDIYREKVKIEREPEHKEHTPRKENEAAAQAVETSKMYSKLLPPEKLLLRMALDGGKNMKTLTDKKAFEDEIFITKYAKRLREIIVKHAESGNILESILLDEELNPAAKDMASRLAFDELRTSDRWESLGVEITETPLGDVISDAVRLLELRKLDTEIERLQKMLSNEEAAEADERVLLEELQRLNLKRIELNESKLY
ncbi:MAG: DNA primase [Chloroflexota bacterium]